LKYCKLITDVKDTFDTAPVIDGIIHKFAVTNRRHWFRHWDTADTSQQCLNQFLLKRLNLSVRLKRFLCFSHDGLKLLTFCNAYSTLQLLTRNVSVDCGPADILSNR